MALEPSLREHAWRILGKRPIVPQKRTWAQVFKVNTIAVSKAELDQRFKEIQSQIRLESFFKVADRANLAQYYDEGLAAIQRREAKKLEEALAQKERDFKKAQKQAESGLTVAEITHWRHLLDVDPKERDAKIIKAAYRRKAQIAHPDRGGSHDAMSVINKAYAAAKRELNF